jgi:undecaprenyl diphosphate synthase
MTPPKLPRHIAIIMDGNGRWAQSRGLPRIMGHRAGVDTVREIVKECAELRIPFLTLYAFSQENWKRPPQEVKLLMELLEHFLDAEKALLIQERVSFRSIGRVDALPAGVQAKIRALEQATAGFDRLTLVVALNYGARGEIIDATRRIAADAAAKRIVPEQIDESMLENNLYTSGLPDPDILIRTSGEMRLSNFLLWQCSYSELFISKKYWPEFTREDLREAVREFGERERRFGAIAT